MLARGCSCGRKDRALVGRWKKAGAETIESAGRNQTSVEDDEAGQILVLASQVHSRARPPCWDDPGGRCRCAGSSWPQVCSENFEVIDLMIARSSATSARCGNRSLTQWPLSPCCLNFHWLFRTLPMLSNCVGSSFPMTSVGSVRQTVPAAACNRRYRPATARHPCRGR